MAQFVSLYKEFISSYHERYNLQLEALVKAYPELDTDIFALRKSLGPFYKIEKKVLARFQNELLKLPAKKRMQYLKRQTPEKLAQLELLLGALMGLEQSPEDVQLTPWCSHLKVIENIGFKSGDIVAEFGVNIGRFGLLLGLLHPEVIFLGFELNTKAQGVASEAARKNGFINTKFSDLNKDQSQEQFLKAQRIYVSGSLLHEVQYSIARLLQISDLDRELKIYSLEALDSQLIQTNFRNLIDPEVFVYQNR